LLHLVDYGLSEEYWEFNSLIARNFVKTSEKNKCVAWGKRINISLPTDPTFHWHLDSTGNCITGRNARHFYLSLSIDMEVISFALEIYLRKCLIRSVLSVVTEIPDQLPYKLWKILFPARLWEELNFLCGEHKLTNHVRHCELSLTYAKEFV